MSSPSGRICLAGRCQVPVSVLVVAGVAGDICDTQLPGRDVSPPWLAGALVPVLVPFCPGPAIAPSARSGAAGSAAPLAPQPLASDRHRDLRLGRLVEA